MPYYTSLGEIPTKRHIQYRRPDGALYSEEVFGTEGFDGPTSTMYHIHPPTQVSGWKHEYSTTPEYVETNVMRMRHLVSKDMQPNGDPITGRTVLFGNGDCEMGVCVPEASMEYYFKNGQGDECIFIHDGSGTLYTMFGTLKFSKFDFVIIPKGTIYKMEFDERAEGSPENRFMFIETANASHILPPKRYIAEKTAQFLEHAPYCERDLRIPEMPLAYDEMGEFEVRIKALNSVHSYIYPYHPISFINLNYP